MITIDKVQFLETPIREGREMPNLREALIDTGLTSSERIGTENLERFINAIADLATIARNVFADGKVTISDLGSLVPLGTSAFRLVTAIGPAIPEIRDLSWVETERIGGVLMRRVREVFTGNQVRQPFGEDQHD